jgi:hypothetical protein
MALGYRPQFVDVVASLAEICCCRSLILIDIPEQPVRLRERLLRSDVPIHWESRPTVLLFVLVAQGW